MTRTCEWCRVPLENTLRQDAKFHSKACRQSHWRFARHRVVAARADTPLRLAYADPPYPGKAHLYRSHPDYAGEVDHRELLVALSSYDGWALSTSSSPGLQIVLALCSELELEGVRVASWHRGARRTVSRRAWRAWEPVVYRGGREVSRTAVRDVLRFVSRPRTSDPRRVVGAKPSKFAFWVFRLLGARAGDELADLFPGSGGIGRAWDLFVGGAA